MGFVASVGPRVQAEITSNAGGGRTCEREREESVDLAVGDERRLKGAGTEGKSTN